MKYYTHEQTVRMQKYRKQVLRKAFYDSGKNNVKKRYRMICRAIWQKYRVN